MTTTTSLKTFFQGGQEETESPFLTPETRWLGKNLSLKASSLGALLLTLSFALSFKEEFLWLSHFLLVIVYFLVGPPSLIEAIEDLLALEVNIDVLMTLAAFSSVFIGNGFEGALLLVLFSLSHAMEDAVTTKAKSAISDLSELSPSKAFIKEPDGSLIEKALTEIKPQELILVKAGEVIPLDGVITSGTSSVNLVHLTGENFPIRKTVGDEVAAGARNLEGSLTVRVLRTSSDSTLAKIIELVTKAQDAKPKMQRTFDALSKGYAIGIISLSFLFAITLPFLFHIPFLKEMGSIYRALAFLIAASPCALILAIPTAYLSAISALAKKGIVLKGGTVLDALEMCKTIAFDKTGTLTTGDLNLESIKVFREKNLIEASETEAVLALQIAYGLEQHAVHPIGKALIEKAKEKKLLPIEIKNFHSVPGSGIEGFIDSSSPSSSDSSYVFLGRAEALDGMAKEPLESLKEAGFLIAALKHDKEITLFCFTDTPRAKIKETIDSLKQKGLNLVMLTGDHETSAKRVAKELGLSHYFANLRPDEKLEHVSKLSEEGGLVMVGDGINDAPALARATVGISMGQVGSAAAIDASDIVLLRDNIELLDWLIGKAQMTKRIVRQNLTLAFSAIILASLPALLGFVPLWLAVVLHEGGTVLVGLNALRLLKSNN